MNGLIFQIIQENQNEEDYLYLSPNNLASGIGEEGNVVSFNVGIIGINGKKPNSIKKGQSPFQKLIEQVNIKNTELNSIFKDIKYDNKTLTIEAKYEPPGT